MNWLTAGLWVLVFLPLLTQAADDDFELEFFIKQKSTISDFPFQAIGQEELSDAAIEGALKATSTGAIEKSGKPAYAEQNDSSEKRKQSELEPVNTEPTIDDILKYGQEPPSIPQLPQEPFAIPDGRTYGGHSFKAFER